MLIGPSKNIANNGKGMYVGLKQPCGDGERCVTPARAAAKETSPVCDRLDFQPDKIYVFTSL